MVTLYIHNYEIGFTKFNMWFIKKNGKWIGQSGRCNSRHMIKPYDVLKILRLQDIDCMEWIVEDPYTVVGTEPVYDIDTGEVILQCKPRTPFEIFNAMKNKVRIEIRCDALPTEADPYTIYISKHRCIQMHLDIVKHILNRTEKKISIRYCVIRLLEV